MPLLRQEGGPEEDPQARRPAGSLRSQPSAGRVGIRWRPAWSPIPLARVRAF